MYNFYYYDDNGYQSDSAWKVIFLLGLIVIFLGLIILFVPEILILIIVSILFTLGGIIIANAMQMRKLSKQGHRIKIKWFD
ncbi:hypothetical protein JXJ21_03130 [candidate division KSB1 bacterium]|nr:hypothetical protein [candidate division KSB1 bacterium]